MVCGADQQGGALASGETEAGVVEDFAQRTEGLETRLDIGFHQREQAPGQFDGLDLNPGVLEFGLFRQGVERRQGQDIAAQALEEAIAPVHRQEGLAGAHRVVCAHRQDQRATPALQAHELPVPQLAAAQFLGMQVHQGLLFMAEQACAGAGPAHAVPLVAQASGIEGQRVARVAFFLGGAVGFGDQLRASRGGREAAVCIEPCGAVLRASGKWPLLRPQAVEQCVAEAGKIEVAPGGEQLVFVEQAAAVGKGEQAGFSGPQMPFQAAREVADDVPVLACFPGAERPDGHD